MIYYEMIYSTQLEIAKQTEIGKRLTNILQHVVQQFVPSEQQREIISAMERAKNITPQVYLEQEVDRTHWLL